MSNDGVNTTRRRFLTAATSVVGAAGVVGVAVPFVGSWQPSAKAKAAGALGTVIITQIDSDGKPLETWTLWNAFVKDVQLGQLSYGDDELTTTTVELMYDWARVETANPSVAVAGGGKSFFNT